MDWIMEHEGLKKKDDYFDTSNRTQHVVRYENGDSIQVLEYYHSIFEKQTETIVNNKTVQKKRCKFEHFGWSVIDIQLF